MKTIRFLADRVVRDELEGSPDETRYKKGQQITVDDRSAQHWIDRGVAIEVEKTVVRNAAKEAKKAPTDAVKNDD